MIEAKSRLISHIKIKNKLKDNISYQKATCLEILASSKCEVTEISTKLHKIA